MNTTIHQVARAIFWTGLLSFLTGLLYIPWLPWYVLGSLTEAEIGSWGISSIGGGLLAGLGSYVLYRDNKLLKQSSLIIASFGMCLFILAQVPALFSWMMFFGSPITEAGDAQNVTTGSLLHMVPHLLIGVAAIYSTGLITKVLLGKSSVYRLHPKQFAVTAIVLAAIGLGWFAVDAYADATWIEHTYPADGAQNVPLHTMVTVQWESSGNNMGMQVRYADDPSVPIHGATEASRNGISFTPDLYLPGKEVVIEVSSGRRERTFSFLTEENANDKVDLYRSVLKQFFRSPQGGGKPPYVVALDTSGWEGWSKEETESVAKGILVYHGDVAVGSRSEGFHPINEMSMVDPEGEALVIAIERTAEDQISVHTTRGIGVLSGKEGTSFSVHYTIEYKEMTWHATPKGEEDSRRPWGE